MGIEESVDIIAFDDHLKLPPPEIFKDFWVTGTLGPDMNKIQKEINNISGVPKIAFAGMLIIDETKGGKTTFIPHLPFNDKKKE